jgi:pilus assembly protein CpaC
MSAAMAPRLIAVLAACLLLVVRTGDAQQRPVTSRPAPTHVLPLVLETGSGRVLTLSSAVANVFIADPKVAEVRPASSSTLFIFGIASGRTTLAALDARGRVVAQYEVTVRPSVYNAGAAAASVAKALPGSAVYVDPLASGLMVTGTVASAEEAERVVNIVRSYAGDKQTVMNDLRIAASVQISLRVRIVEMSRTVSREIGINWQAIQGLGKYAQIGLATSNPVSASSATANALSAGYAIGNTNLSTIIDALAQDDLVHVLAEPNLTTMSGEPASFLVGGEFPIPIAQQNNATTITFKQYGVNLSFVPTVFGGRRISVHVRPEVSQLSNQGAVQLSAGNGSISVPALTVRRADTTVEVGSGDSFAIAGLLQEDVTQAVSGIPLLGELPILGPLFRSDSFQRNESELVIIVTPYIVRPVSDPAAYHLPNETYTPPSDLERILLLRQVGQARGAAPAHIAGVAGFVVE